MRKRDFAAGGGDTSASAGEAADGGARGPAAAPDRPAMRLPSPVTGALAAFEGGGAGGRTSSGSACSTSAASASSAQIACEPVGCAGVGDASCAASRRSHSTVRCEACAEERWLSGASAVSTEAGEEPGPMMGESGLQCGVSSCDAASSTRREELNGDLEEYWLQQSKPSVSS